MHEAQELSEIVRLAFIQEDSTKFIIAEEQRYKKSPKKRAAHFFWIGLKLFGTYPEHALASWKNASKYFIEIGDKVGEIDCYINLGIGYGKLGNFANAIEFCRIGLELAQDIGDVERKYICHFSLGADYYGLGEFQRAIENHITALNLANSIKGDENFDNHSKELSCFFQIAYDYAGLGEFQNAITNFDAALNLATDKGLQVKCYIQKGICYRKLGDFRKAIENHGLALKIAKGIENSKPYELACFSNLGNNCQILGNYQQSIEYHLAALDICLHYDDEFAKAECYNNLGNAYYNLGSLHKAIESYTLALEIAKHIQSIPLQDSTSVSIAGDVMQKYYVGNKPVQRILLSACYNNIANTYQKLRDFEKAIENHTLALDIARGIKPTEAGIISNLGSDYQMMGDFHKALALHHGALALTQEVGDKNLESQCLANLGNDCYYGGGNPIDAIEYYKNALRTAETIGNVNSQRLVSLFLGYIYRTKNVDAAYNYLVHSINLAEDIRGKLAEEDHKINFFASELDAYELVIDLCLELKKYESGFEFLERSKSRAFLDILASSKIRQPYANEIKPLLQQEQLLLGKLREIQTRYLRNISFATAPGEVENLRNKLNEIYDKIENKDKEYVSLRRANPLSVARVQNMLW